MAYTQQSDDYSEKSVPVADMDTGTWFVKQGDRFLYRTNGKVGTVIGWDFPVTWDDGRDRYKSCAADANGAEYQQITLLCDDGTTEHVTDTHNLMSPWTMDRIGFLEKPKVEILSYDDMVAMPDPEALIEGLIFKETSALLFGKSNAFKSFLGIDIACCVGTGTRWHGANVSGPLPVMYVATEGSRGVGKQRIPGWMEAHNIPHQLRQNVSLVREEIALDNPNWVNDLLQSVAAVKAKRALLAGETVFLEDDPSDAVALIVIDIFGASMSGPETSDETARAWVRSVNRIMQEVKCAVLTVAHTGWADETRARMHTHFWGSFDTRLKAVGDKDSLTTVLTVDRHKDADSGGQWGFRMDKVTMPNGQTTLVPRLCDEVETSQKRRVSGKPAVALQALSEALIEHGRTIAGPNYPACPVVTVEQWRVMADRHGLTDSDNPDTKRKTFNRHKDTLLEKALVRQFDGHVWKVNVEA